LLTLSILFSVLLVAVADATEYTVRPSQNIGKEPGTSMSGETVQECEPIPFWLFLLLCLFPQLTAAPIETLIPLKATVGYLGYTRIHRGNALDSQRRLAILSFIRANPGLHLRELMRRMPIARGTLEYHIKKLESGGLLKSVPEKGRLHYFSADQHYSTEEETLIIAMENAIYRRIITRLYLNRSARTADFAKEAHRSNATIYVHLKHLESLGIVTSERVGRYVQYTLTDSYSRVLREHPNSYREPLRFRCTMMNEPVSCMRITWTGGRI
jgi:predicted transcriptional regulator